MLSASDAEIGDPELKLILQITRQPLHERSKNINMFFNHKTNRIPEGNTATAFGRGCPQHLNVRLGYGRRLYHSIGTPVAEFS